MSVIHARHLARLIQEPQKLRRRVVHALRTEFRHVERRILLEFERESAFGTTDLIHLIAPRLKLKNYLELCPSTTGLNYWDIMRWRFNNTRRLMYNCPDSFDDGLD